MGKKGGGKKRISQPAARAHSAEYQQLSTLLQSDSLDEKQTQEALTLAEKLLKNEEPKLNNLANTTYKTEVDTLKDHLNKLTQTVEGIATLHQSLPAQTTAMTDLSVTEAKAAYQHQIKNSLSSTLTAFTKIDDALGALEHAGTQAAYVERLNQNKAKLKTEMTPSVQSPEERQQLEEKKKQFKDAFREHFTPKNLDKTAPHLKDGIEEALNQMVYVYENAISKLTVTGAKELGKEGGIRDTHYFNEHPSESRTIVTSLLKGLNLGKGTTKLGQKLQVETIDSKQYSNWTASGIFSTDPMRENNNGTRAEKYGELRSITTIKELGEVEARIKKEQYELNGRQTIIKDKINAVPAALTSAETEKSTLQHTKENVVTAVHTALEKEKEKKLAAEKHPEVSHAKRAEHQLNPGLQQSANVQSHEVQGAKGADDGIKRDMNLDSFMHDKQPEKSFFGKYWLLNKIVEVAKSIGNGIRNLFSGGKEAQSARAKAAISPKEETHAAAIKQSRESRARDLPGL